MEDSTRRTTSTGSAPWARVAAPWEKVESAGRGIPRNTRNALGRLAGSAHRAGIPPRKVSVAAAGCGIGAAVAIALSSWVGSDVGRFWWILLAVILLGARLAGNIVLESLRTRVSGDRRIGDIPVSLVDAAADVLLLIAAGGATFQVWLTRDNLDAGLTFAWIAAILSVVAPYLTALGELGGVGRFTQGPMSSRRAMYVLILAGILSWFEALGSSRGYIFAVALLVIVAGWATTIAMRLWFMGQALTVRRAEAAARVSSQTPGKPERRADNAQQPATRRIDMVRPDTPARKIPRPSGPYAPRETREADTA